MRAESARLWRDFLSGYARIHFYTVDPGAHAIAVELVPLARDLGLLSGWFADGWSAARAPECRSALELNSGLGAGATLLLGSQMDYRRTRSLLRAAEEAGATTVFVFDHWKNYAKHFGDNPLPDVIVVPDTIAQEQFLATVGAHAAPRLRILPHPGVDAAAERVLSWQAEAQPGLIALLLDPTEAADGLGYDWRGTLASALAAAGARRGARLMVKPHPRQDIDAVKDEVTRLDRDHRVAEVYTGETDRLIATADEVWGMTTSALNVALAVGKRIRSFQIGRNAHGERASNPHIEPFVIVR
jgi:hypothetical protein